MISSFVSRFKNGTRRVESGEINQQIWRALPQYSATSRKPHLSPGSTPSSHAHGAGAAWCDLQNKALETETARLEELMTTETGQREEKAQGLKQRCGGQCWGFRRWCPAHDEPRLAKPRTRCKSTARRNPGRNPREGGGESP